jgi:hypothetical protein
MPGLMSRCLVIFVLIAGCAISARSQPAPTPFTLYLVGDGGAAYSVEGTPALAMLRDSLQACPGTCSVLFLGDNLYESGLAPEGHPDRARGEQIMNAQIESARVASGHVVFVPGNHDSGSIGVGGDFERLIEMQRYVEERIGERSFLPADGSPGPVVLDVAPDVAIVFINSQWWFEADHRGERTGHIASPHRNEVLARLDSVLTALADRHIVLAAHHPIRSAGEHAMYWPTRPTFSGLLNRIVGAPQDFDERAYEVYRNDIGRILERHPDVILAAGHDHVLAYIADGDGHHVVSGSASKLDWVSERAGAHYASALPGMAAMRFHSDGAVQLTFAAIDAGRREMQFDQVILRKDLATTGADFEISDWTINPRPASNWGLDAAPTYSPDRGPGASASVSWIAPASPLREARTATLRARYDHRIEMLTIGASATIRRTGWRYFVHGDFVNAAHFDLFRAHPAYPYETERLLTYRRVASDIGFERLGYDDLVRIGLHTGVRVDHVSPLAQPTVAPFEYSTDVALTLGGSFIVNTIDSEVLPHGGASLTLHTDLHISDNSTAHARAAVHARLFRSIGFDRPLTLGVHAAARTYTGNDAFYLRHFLGDGDGLRGYPEWRFSGDRIVHGSFEARATLGHLDGARALRPFGLLAFSDGGLLRMDGIPPVVHRVWMPHPPIIAEWIAHGSAGLGIWANTSRLIVMNATAAYGSEGWRLTIAPRFAF